MLLTNRNVLGFLLLISTALLLDPVSYILASAQCGRSCTGTQHTHTIDMTVPQTMAADVGPMLMGINGQLNETKRSSMLPQHVPHFLFDPLFYACVCICVWVRGWVGRL